MMKSRQSQCGATGSKFLASSTRIARCTVPLAKLRRCTICFAAATESSALQDSSRPEGQQPGSSSNSTADADGIYIGFQKGDYDRRAGRKGRVIKDDPSKYPDKESIGPFLYATGGWAGGEVALQKMLEAETKPQAKAAEPKPAAISKSKSSGRQPSLLAPPAPGKEIIYLGYGKGPEEIARRNAGEKGKVIVVDKTAARVYPGKDDLGPLLGATGGFAGGEAGLQQFIESGEVKLRDPKDPAARKQFSIVSIAGLVALAGVGGGILLTEVFDVGEGVFNQERLAQIAVDPNTRTLLLAALGLLALSGALAATRAATLTLQERMRARLEGLNRLTVTAAFGVVVFLAARTILEL